MEHLETAHLDGYRVHAFTSDDSLTLKVVLIQQGEVICEQPFWSVTLANRSDLNSMLPEFHRREKLLSALLRAINEGAEWLELRAAMDGTLMLLEQCPLHVDVPLVAVEEEATHLRTFLLPDGNYLSIVEDLSMEIVSPSDMQRYIEEEAAAEAGTALDELTGDVDSDNLGLF